jgi:hypothetical protein
MTDETNLEKLVDDLIQANFEMFTDAWADYVPNDLSPHHLQFLKSMASNVRTYLKSKGRWSEDKPHD